MVAVLVGTGAISAHNRTFSSVSVVLPSDSGVVLLFGPSNHQISHVTVIEFLWIMFSRHERGALFCRVCSQSECTTQTVNFVVVVTGVLC